jgi:hypothetical protein
MTIVMDDAIARLKVLGDERPQRRGRLHVVTELVDLERGS